MMKRTSVIFGLLGILLFATHCVKDHHTPRVIKKLQGTWQLDEVTGGFSGQGYTTDWNLLELMRDFDYQLLSDETFIADGDYDYDIDQSGVVILKFDHNAGSGQPETIFEAEVKEAQLTEDGNRLILSDPCCDQFRYVFTRLEE